MKRKLLLFIVISIQLAYGYNYSKDVFYIKQEINANFHVQDFVSANGYATDSKDKYFNTVDWASGVIGYLPILGRVPNIGVNLEYLGDKQTEINTSKGYIIPLQLSYSTHFFDLVKSRPVINSLIATYYYVLIFNSDPGSADNKNYHYNSVDPCAGSEFITYATDAQIANLSEKIDTFNLIKVAYAKYKGIVINGDEQTRKVNCVTSQLAIYLLPKKYFN